MQELSTEKLKAGIFDGPQMRQLIKDPGFIYSMNQVEPEACTSFVANVENVLGKHKAQNYVQIVNKMFNSFKSLGCNMSIKIHYLHSHSDRFPENLGDMREEQSKRFHQGIEVMEDHY